jgi:hypothetical protein
MELSDALGISDRAVFSLLAQMDESFSIYSERDPDNKRCVRYKAKSSDPNLKLPLVELSDLEKTYLRYLAESPDAVFFGNEYHRLINKVR